MTIDNELALEFLRKTEHDLGSARLVVDGRKSLIQAEKYYLGNKLYA